MTDAHPTVVPHRIVVKALHAQIPSKGKPVSIEHGKGEPLLIEIDAIGFVDSDAGVAALLTQDHSAMPAANERCVPVVEETDGEEAL